MGNRSFPGSLVPLFQNESKCESFHVKTSSACSFIFMPIKVIFIRMVLHLDSKTEAQGNSEMAHSSRQDGAILPAQVANHSTGISSSCQLMEQPI